MSEHRNDGGPAFPRPDWNGSWHGPDSFPGMSLRDWFAGQALAYSMDLATKVGRDADPTTLGVSIAYNIADAMIAARSK